MGRQPLSVDDAIARFDELTARIDGHTPAHRSASRRAYGRTARALTERIVKIAVALVVLAIGTVAAGLFLNGIGWTGLFIVAVLTVLILFFFGLSGGEARPVKRVQYTEQMPNQAVVKQLDSYLSGQRAALPAPAARKVDAISSQLPLLESRLGEVDALDPLAQDARRLMGKHLPDLIERYERVPAEYRQQRDAEGLTVDERLVVSLDAAREALDDIGRRLAKDDLNAFETQGRFIQSRYKENSGLGGE